MPENGQLFVFIAGGRRLALDLGCVERIVSAVEITPLPGAADAVSGVIDVQGRILPVVDLRQRFSLAETEVEPSDRIIIMRTSRGEVALLVSEAIGVAELASQEVVAAERQLPGAHLVKGVANVGGALTFICDPERILPAGLETPPWQQALKHGSQPQVRD